MAAVTAVALCGCTTISPRESTRLILVRDGEALAKIVIPKDAPGAVRFAADELRDYLARVSGAAFEITGTDPGVPPRIYLGDSAAARAVGLDVSGLKRDGFFRFVVGDDLYILGRDTPDDGRWRGPAHALHGRPGAEHATLFGVYDFLEDVCGVRFFMAGTLGEVVPKHRLVAVPRTRVREEPAFTARRMSQLNIFHYWFKDAKDLCNGPDDRYLWALRMRWETHNPVPGCHSCYYLKFGERFGDEHPEWFSLTANGQRAARTRRGPFLCWSQPGVAEAFAADARAYFTGKSPKTRGLESWYGSGYHGATFMVDPNDGYVRCRCEACRSVLEKYPGQNYSEIVFTTVAKVADAVRDLEGKYITTLAYPPKTFPPKSVRLPANARVRLCVSGPDGMLRPSTGQAQLALIQAWSRRTDGDLVLWTYPNRSFHGTDPQRGAIETLPHATSAFLKEARPYIDGVFFENEAIYETNRALDSYVMMKLAWDPDQDVDALLEDYFTNFYGPAAVPVRALYARLEEDWTRLMTFYPDPGIETMRTDDWDTRLGADSIPWAGHPLGTATEKDRWGVVYNAAELDRFDTWLKEAEALVVDQPEYAARVAILRKYLYGTLVTHRRQYAQSQPKRPP